MIAGKLRSCILVRCIADAVINCTTTAGYRVSPDMTQAQVMPHFMHTGTTVFVPADSIITVLGIIGSHHRVVQNNTLQVFILCKSFSGPIRY